MTSIIFNSVKMISSDVDINEPHTLYPTSLKDQATTLAYQREFR